MPDDIEDIERRNKTRDREIPVAKRPPGPGQTRPEMLAPSPGGTPEDVALEPQPESPVGLPPVKPESEGD